jgi:hypothetical protein
MLAIYFPICYIQIQYPSVAGAAEVASAKTVTPLRQPSKGEQHHA